MQSSQNITASCQVCSLQCCSILILNTEDRTQREMNALSLGAHVPYMSSLCATEQPECLLFASAREPAGSIQRIELLLSLRCISL